MRNQEKIQELTLETLEQALEPIVNCQIHFHDQRMLISEMYATTVENAPDDEIDNFTARRLKVFYLAWLQVLENLGRIDQLVMNNGIMMLDRIDPKLQKY